MSDIYRTTPLDDQGSFYCPYYAFIAAHSLSLVSSRQAIQSDLEKCSLEVQRHRRDIARK